MPESQRRIQSISDVFYKNYNRSKRNDNNILTRSHNWVVIGRERSNINVFIFNWESVSSGLHSGYDSQFFILVNKLKKQQLINGLYTPSQGRNQS